MVSVAGIGPDIVGAPYKQLNWDGTGGGGNGPKAHGWGGAGTGSYTIFSTTLGGGLFGVSWTRSIICWGLFLIIT